MKKIYFATKKEAYEGLVEALRTKVDIIKATGYDNLNEEALFNYFVNNKWIMISEISLSEMVSDILAFDNQKIINHFKIINFLKEGEKK